MLDTVLVTCIYNVSYNEPIGGRGYTIGTYFPSIVNIINLGLPVIFYTDKEGGEQLDIFLQTNNFCVTPNYEIRLHDLKTYRHFDKILSKKIAHVNPEYRFYHRCEVLCHTKLYFVEQSYNNKWDKHNVIWIDAGITECSKVPLKYGGTELGDSGIVEKYKHLKYPINSHCLFSPMLGNCLNNLVIKEKWFFTELQSPYDGSNDMWGQHLSSLLYEKYGLYLNNCKWVVGTIWGGNKESFDKIYKVYNIIVDELVNCNLYPKTEEMYLSAVNFIFQFKVFKFDTWYIDIPGEAEYVEGFWMQSSDSKSFYKIFHDIMEYK